MHCTFGEPFRPDVRARILPPEMLTEIIEEYTKATMTPAQPAVAAPVNPLPEMTVQPDTELSTKERIAQLANEALPGTKDVTAPGEEKVLSPEEVEKFPRRRDVVEVEQLAVRGL